MSFGIALSGLSAAQKDLDTTANNIANVNTTGFKESRAEFANVYAASIFSSGRTKVGDGVLTAQVAQQFNQGSLQFTQNSLDLAITGEGFFVTTPDLSSRDYSFTRAGAFKLNKDNFIVDASGNLLQGFQVDPATGDASSVSLSTTVPVQIPDTAGAPRATSAVNTTMNLDADSAVPSNPAFDPTDRTSFTDSTSLTIYDSLGEPHILGLYYVKTATAGQWDVHVTLDGTDLSGVAGSGVGTGAGTPASTISFNSNGTPNVVAPATTFNPINLVGGAGLGITTLLSNGAQFPATLAVNFSDSANKVPTQFSGDFEVNALEQDGATVGRLTGIDINDAGKIVASFSNGDSTFLGQVALVRFANDQGLTQIGGNSWKKSLDSGEPLAGEASTGTFGNIKSSALEASNVNLTTELVDLISAQRNFQANSRALEVNTTLQQTVLQIR